jgi:hypothetical protein
MFPEWLTKDGFIWQELISFAFTLLASGLFLWIGRGILFNRDRKIQELDRQRNLLDDLRKELVQIFNDYYRVRKRYSTVKDSIAGHTRRNPYIGQLGEKHNEVMDSLLVSCIALEAQYYSLMERLRISFPQLWKRQLGFLMEKEAKYGETRARNNQALESYFDRIRDYIEQERDIDRQIKRALSETFSKILSVLNEYENQLLVSPPPKKGAGPEQQSSSVRRDASRP